MVNLGVDSCLLNLRVDLRALLGYFGLGGARSLPPAGEVGACNGKHGSQKAERPGLELGQ
ncbi:MAG TPA: hypothetical protein VF151_10115 [Gemmatimonadales bacterium]